MAENSDLCERLLLVDLGSSESEGDNECEIESDALLRARRRRLCCFSDPVSAASLHHRDVGFLSDFYPQLSFPLAVHLATHNDGELYGVILGVEEVVLLSQVHQFRQQSILASEEIAKANIDGKTPLTFDKAFTVFGDDPLASNVTTEQ